VDAAQQRNVLGPKDRALAEVGPKVVREHAAFDVRRLRRGSVQSNRLH
jgi:hypothetical protein